MPKRIRDQGSWRNPTRLWLNQFDTIEAQCEFFKTLKIFKAPERCGCGGFAFEQKFCHRYWLSM